MISLPSLSREPWVKMSTPVFRCIAGQYSIKCVHDNHERRNQTAVRQLPFFKPIPRGGDSHARNATVAEANRGRGEGLERSHDDHPVQHGRDACGHGFCALAHQRAPGRFHRDEHATAQHQPWQMVFYPYSYLGMTKRSMYVDHHEHEGSEGRRGRSSRDRTSTSSSIPSGKPASGICSRRKNASG